MDGLKSDPENSLFDDEMLRELLDYEVDSESLFLPVLSSAQLDPPQSPPSLPPVPKSKHRKVSHKSANLQDKHLLSESKRTTLESLKVEERLSLMGESRTSREESEELAEALAACPAGVKRVAVSEIKSRVAAIEESIALAKSVLSKLLTQPK